MLIGSRWPLPFRYFAMLRSKSEYTRYGVGVARGRLPVLAVAVQARRREYRRFGDIFTLFDALPGRYTPCRLKSRHSQLVR